MGCHGNAKNTISPWNFLKTFFYETGHLPDIKTVVKISQEN